MEERTFKILEVQKVLDKLVSYSNTEKGKDMSATLMPFDNEYEVNRALKETKEAYTYVVKKGRAPIYSDKGLKEVLSRVEKGGELNAKEILIVGRSLRTAREITVYLDSDDIDENSLRDSAVNITTIKWLEDKIEQCIIDEDEISDNASRALGAIRRNLREKGIEIKERVGSMVRNYSKYLMENIYTVRGDRYVLPVKVEYKSTVKGLVHDVSSTGSTVFIEPMELVTLNNEIKELKLKEMAEIERILNEISRDINKNVKALKMNREIISDLDFIFAKGAYGLEIEGIIPEINSNGVYNIVQGRHPLIPSDKVVPLDIHSGEDFTTIVITGPNTGGKTVTLKTVGLLHVMALSGMMIPAYQGSVINVFEGIYADIGDEQSIEQSLSTFSAHMTNIVSILNKAKKNSLVLFDELGSGTDPTEGSALAISVLEELRNRGCSIISTTHYSELKKYGLNTQGVENASVEFDVATLRPTYRLLMGIPGKSNAFEISRKLGLSDDIIKFARENIAKDTLEFEDLIRSLSEKTMEAEKLSRENEILRNEAKDLYEKYKSKLDRIDEVREKSVEAGKEKAKKIIEEAKEEADKILKEMREMERHGITSNMRHEMEKKRKALKDKAEKMESAKKAQGGGLTKVSEGQEVKIISLNAKGVVLSFDDKKQEAVVQAGIMKITSKYSDLQGATVTKAEKKATKREVKLNLKSVSTSLDIRGLDGEEGKYRTDIYLDEAFVDGLEEVTIIHGKGTGALKTAILSMLRNHPHVKKFRDGEYSEGGNGVTVVTLK